MSGLMRHHKMDLPDQAMQNVVQGPWQGQGHQGPSDNLASQLSKQKLLELGMKVKQTYELDEGSRADWVKGYDRALEVIDQNQKAKDYPMPGAANIKYPLLSTAAMQFAARAYPAIVQPGNIVKMKPEGLEPEDPVFGQQNMPVNPSQSAGMGGPGIVPPGLPPGPPPQQMQQMPPQMQDMRAQKTERADRVGKYMSWQLRTRVREWEAETDLLLLQLPYVGCAFRKVFHDGVKNRRRSVLYPARDVIVNMQVRNLDEAPRITQRFILYPYQLQSKIRARLYLDITREATVDLNPDDEQSPIEMLEQLCRYDLDGDGYDEPYIITIHKASGTIARIERNFDPQDIEYGPDGSIVCITPDPIWVKYDFLPNPKGQFYGIGFGHLLRPITETIDTIINQIVDAAHLANASGGFIAKGLRFGRAEQGEQLQVAHNRYHYVNSSGMDLRSQIVPFQHQGPSPVLFDVLGMLVEAGKELGSVKDVLSGETSGQSNMPVGTTLALIEQGQQVFNAIYKRIYRSMSREFEVLFRLNAKHLDFREYMMVTDDPRANPGDFELGDHDITPVADPSAITDMQRMGRAQFVQQFLGSGFIDDTEAMKFMMKAGRIPEYEKLMPKPNPQAEQMQMAMMQAQLDEVLARVEQLRADAQFKRAQGFERVAEGTVHQMEAGLSENEQQRKWTETFIAKEQGDEKLRVDRMKASATPGSKESGGATRT